MKRLSLTVARVLALALWGVVACGGDELDCPAGTIRQGNDCVPATDLSNFDGVIGPTDKGPGENGGADADRDAPDGTTSETGGTDKGPATDNGPIQYPGGFIGQKCQKTRDCEDPPSDGVSCLSWGGETACTVRGCGETRACPEGALCMGITPNEPACAMTCDQDADCRVADGFACKVVPDPAGTLVRICYPVENPGAPGDPCTGPQDCAGAASCLTNFSGGYCAVLTCDAEHPCPDATSCVRVGGKAVCLKTCATPAECAIEGESRTCLALKSAITGDKVNVCASGTTGRETGEQCLNDTECKSGLCKVVFTGKCAALGFGCQVDQDCGTSDVCLQSAADSYGYCTSTCQATNPPCVGQAFCLELQGGLPTSLQGSCMPACGTDKPCRTEAGLSCVYGDPKYNPGHAACVHLAEGMAGSPCKTDAECSTGKCYLGTGGGYCYAACGYFAGAACPFPTACATWKSESACFRRCTATGDCPTGSRCATELAPAVCVAI